MPLQQPLSSLPAEAADASFTRGATLQVPHKATSKVSPDQLENSLSSEPPKMFSKAFLLLTH